MIPAVTHNVDGKIEQREDHSGNAKRDRFAFASTYLDEVVVEIVLQIVCHMVRNLTHEHLRAISWHYSRIQASSRALHAARRQLQVDAVKNSVTNRNARYLHLDRRKYLIER